MFDNKINNIRISICISLPAAEKAQHLSLNSVFELINGISNDLQKLHKYFNGTAIVAFF